MAWFHLNNTDFLGGLGLDMFFFGHSCYHWSNKRLNNMFPAPTKLPTLAVETLGVTFGSVRGGAVDAVDVVVVDAPGSWK